MLLYSSNHHLAGGLHPFSPTLHRPSASPRVRISGKPHRGCSASLGGRGSGEVEEDAKFVQASLLVPETIRHYYLRKQGFLEESKWSSSSNPFSLQSKVSGYDPNFISHSFLRQFHSPTMFLKIACENDMVLPIVVGEFAIETLMDSLRDTPKGECSNQIQFINNLMGILGYEVKKVWITKRVVNMYYAQIFLGKATGSNLSIDSRPSDAVNIANKFKAPIYVNKHIVLKDAIRFHDSRRPHPSKTGYDVRLDSATEGPDVLAEELVLVRKMNEAVMAERYEEAACWRDKLNKLRRSRKGS